MLILLVRLSLLSGCIYRRWTSLSLSAFWYFIPAPPVGSSLSLNVVALPTTYLLYLVLYLGSMVAGAFVNPNGMIRFSNCLY